MQGEDGAIYTVAGTYVSGWTAATGYQRKTAGYACAVQPCVQHAWTFLDGSVDPTGYTADEDYADMFMNWVWDNFSTDPSGEARYNWMNNRMGGWIYGNVN